MKESYKNDLDDALTHALRVKADSLFLSTTNGALKKPEIESIYVNYLLIYCYGKIEHVFKNLLADYFTQPNMPQRCIIFGNGIRERLPGSMAKDKLNGYIRKECSELWLDEINRRCADSTYRCKHDNNYTFNDTYLALTSLTNARHMFAHGEGLYSGKIDDIILYFIKSVVWLYEIDNIISTIG